MTSWIPRLPLPVPLLTAAVVAGLLAGCDSDDASEPTQVPSSSGRPLVDAKCVHVEHAGRELGVTVPAGFTVATPPASSAEIRETYRVNLLSLAERPEDGRTLPTAMLAVYGYGPGEREGQNALELSVLNFKQATGGSSRGEPISATPTTVAGLPGSAGTDTDPMALDYNSTDAADSRLRWWTLSPDDGLFIVTLATTTPDLDEQYAAEIPAGLRPGGC
ncbi:hypothetical protein [Actinophytocola xanthii]|uniref:DUF3558 domain-containing protein n=1 Tax=Actinophytocola xanthii TaxID=1912961 RepID=A0A1Q8CWK9_9PSEU|nr:hypothetical protein [Actinophytocola xanthii]OLF18764.1 hypothetical protein BU204_04490 [Actinophytocola xanthii]